MYKLFVYGILKDRFEGIPATITARCYDLGPYPAITELNAGWPVHGKIISVDADTLSQLDFIEGYPDLYHRQLIKINDEYVQVYVYTDPSKISDFPPCINFKAKECV